MVTSKHAKPGSVRKRGTAIARLASMETRRVTRRTLALLRTLQKTKKN